jgi:hypothetical protein
VCTSQRGRDVTQDNDGDTAVLVADIPAIMADAIAPFARDKHRPVYELTRFGGGDRKAVADFVQHVRELTETRCRLIGRRRLVRCCSRIFVNTDNVTEGSALFNAILPIARNSFPAGQRTRRHGN